jgi:hypothetical protein
MNLFSVKKSNATKKKFLTGSNDSLGGGSTPFTGVFLSEVPLPLSDTSSKSNCTGYLDNIQFMGN